MGKTKKKVIIKPLNECIDLLSLKEINKIYKELNTTEENSVKISKKEKKGTIYNGLIGSYYLFIMLAEKSILNDIKKFINNNKNEELKELLIKKHILFEIDDNYYLAKEFQNYLIEAEKEEFNENKVDIIIDYYILINGIIKMDRLIDLVKESGFEITEDDIIRRANEEDSTYIIENDMVYFNKFASILDKKGSFQLKIYEENRKIVDFNEALLGSVGIAAFIYGSNVFEKFHKLGLDEKKMLDLAQELYTYIMSGIPEEDIFKNIMDAYDIKLKSKEKDELCEMIWDISFQTPSWNLGGYSKEDIYAFEDDAFDCFKEELEFYILGYTLINGIIKIDKFKEILKEYHDIDITKKELINVIKQGIEDINITIFKDYICYSKISAKELNLILSLKLIDDYKIIEDLQELLDEEDDFYDRLDNLCNKYGLNDESKSDLFFALRLGTINKDFINSVLTKNCNMLLPIMSDALYNDLIKLMNNTRMWILNGYTPLEQGKSANDYVELIMS